nr:MAG TPA: hypothetical protein [Caudoviricetes sp.]
MSSKSDTKIRKVGQPSKSPFIYVNISQTRFCVKYFI